MKIVVPGLIHEDCPGNKIDIAEAQSEGFANAVGPVKDIVASPTYFDLTMDPLSSHTFPTDTEHTVFAYVFEGSALFGEARGKLVTAGSMALLGAGDAVTIKASEDGARMILVSGAPLREPIAWRGPIVMNTEAELDTAFREYRDGTFIKVATDEDGSPR